MKLQLVVHSWKYSRLLTYQLTSLVERAGDPYAPDLTATVFFSPADLDTRRVAEFFAGIKRPGNLHFDWQALAQPELTNRAIGRNLAAKATAADVVWFADADYVVLPGFWRAITEALPHVEQPLWYPRVVKGTTHPEGMAAIARAQGPPRLLAAPTDNLIDQEFRKAIGGIQFVKGRVCRERGYLDGQAKQLRPYTDGNWRANVEDARFRRGLGTPGQAVDMPGLLRIRHGERGGPAHVVEF